MNVVPPVRVQRARPEHHEAVGRILVDSYVQAGYFEEWGEDPNAPDSYAVEMRDVAGRAERSTVLVALVGEGDQQQVAGTMTVAWHGSSVAEIALEGEAELRMLGVDAAFRGRGVASVLLDESIALARASGARALVLLSIEPQDHVEARYRKRGFARAPERDEHWDPEAVAAGLATPYPVWRLEL